MTILYKHEGTGLEAGINKDGELYLGDNSNGYNLSDTPAHRKYVKRDFDRYVHEYEHRYDD